MSEDAIRMTCSEFEEVLNDLGRVGMPEGALRAQALAHAESCNACARLLTETESLDFALQAIAAQECDHRAPAHVEAALLEAFRQQKQTSARPQTWWRIAALAAAAAVLLAVSFSIKEYRQPDTNSTRVPPSGQLAATASSSAAASSEFGTGFVSLPYADDSENLEGAEEVRVALSRSALASLGVPVIDATDTTEVPADLIVTPDGTPQAIRLVSEETTN